VFQQAPYMHLFENQQHAYARFALQLAESFRNAQ
jgi:hypothetical protein